MSDRALMGETLAQGLTRLRGRPVEVRALSRTPLASSSSFRTERLSVRLDDGRRLRVFFKDLDPQHQTEKARALRRVELEPSRRELEMYRTVLSPQRFDTLHLYAYRWEPDLSQYWLFLEDGGRALLRNTRNPDAWLAAARWAGRFHALTGELVDGPASFLPRLDAVHYERCERAVQDMLPQLAGAERDLVAGGLDWFRECVPELLAMPPAVVHGQFFGQNIVLRGTGPTRKVAVVDWETAALGPGLIDLASLTAGRWTPAERQAMVEAYREAYQRHDGAAVEPDAFRRQLNVVALYLSLEWLGWWGRHRGLSRDFAKFLLDLERLVAERESERLAMRAEL